MSLRIVILICLVTGVASSALAAEKSYDYCGGASDPDRTLLLIDGSINSESKNSDFDSQIIGKVRRLGGEIDEIRGEMNAGDHLYFWSMSGADGPGGLIYKYCHPGCMTGVLGWDCNGHRIIKDKKKETQKIIKAIKSVYGKKEEWARPNIIDSVRDALTSIADEMTVDFIVIHSAMIHKDEKHDMLSDDYSFDDHFFDIVTVKAVPNLKGVRVKAFGYQRSIAERPQAPDAFFSNLERFWKDIFFAFEARGEVTLRASSK